MPDTPSNPSQWFKDKSNTLSKWYQNKDSTIRKYVRYMLSRTAQMFVYQNLPSTMSPQFMETALQSYGQLCIARIPSSALLPDAVINTDELLPTDPIPGPGVDLDRIIEQADEATDELTGSSAASSLANGIYYFKTETGGRPDIYYRPTKCIVANPLFKESQSFTIGKDCVLLRNDIYSQGLLPIMFRYAKEYIESDITIISTFLNTRVRTIIEASNGPEIESARAFLADIEAGKMSVITSRPMLDGIKVWSEANASTASILAQVIEARQALQVAWYNELGIDPNFSLKREYVSAEEIGSNTDLLMPLVDHMLVCRKNGVDAINRIFGTDIKVEKASAWAHKSRMAQSNAVELVSELSQENKDGENDNVSGNAEPDKNSA